MFTVVYHRVGIRRRGVGAGWISRCEMNVTLRDVPGIWRSLKHTSITANLQNQPTLILDAVCDRMVSASGMAESVAYACFPGVQPGAFVTGSARAGQSGGCRISQLGRRIRDVST